MTDLPGMVPDPLADLELYRKDEKLLAQWDEALARWQSRFPGLDVLYEVRRAHDWELTQSPSRRKRNRVMFLSKWLDRVQEKGGSAHVVIPTAVAGAQSAKGESGVSVDLDWLRSASGRYRAAGEARRSERFDHGGPAAADGADPGGLPLEG